MKMAPDDYNKWRDEVYQPRMQELYRRLEDVERRCQDEQAPIREQVKALARENTDNLGGPN